MFGDINIGTVALVILVVLILILIVSNIQIVQQSKAYVVERLGAFHAVWGVGLHLKVPFIERVVKKVSLKEQVADFPPQPVITRDNVTMQIDTVVFFQVMDAKLYTYGVNQPIAAIESLSATTLRNIIGEMELDHTLTSRDVINGTAGSSRSAPHPAPRCRCCGSRHTDGPRALPHRCAPVVPLRATACGDWRSAPSAHGSAC